MKNFEPSDIVVFVDHPLPDIIGRSAEIQSVHPNGWTVHPLLTYWAPGETWYVVIDSAGDKRCAAHPWLRKVPPLWTPSRAQQETTA